ncbi:MAG: hypothetical protein QNJ67_00075 [Kiloniellales bacterium]|nr:hypothetical protein [Kiloniellales bacterium]
MPQERLPSARSEALDDFQVMELYRIEGGKPVERWELRQPIER